MKDKIDEIGAEKEAGKDEINRTATIGTEVGIMTDTERNIMTDMTMTEKTI